MFALLPPVVYLYQKLTSFYDCLLFMKHIVACTLLLCWSSLPRLFAQTMPPFVVNGSATQLSGQCYQLTPEQPTQGGSIWSQQQIDLNQSFEAEATVYLGCASPITCFEDADDGADGIVFAFQPLSTSIGATGGGIGIQGVTPSLCIELDTYPNGGNSDPLYDHIRIFANGDLDHASPNSLTAAVPLIDAATNAEDCTEHILNVSWNAPSQTITVYFDCELKLTYTGNVVNNIFGGNPNLYWGFTSATGACTSEHRVCVQIPPTFQVNDTTICAGATVQLSAPDNASSYLWTPATGLSNPTIANPVATPNTTTAYNLAITNDCGFVTNFGVTITVLPQPTTQIDTFLCTGNLIFVGGFPYNTAGTYTVSYPMPAGCDSIVTINITERQPSASEVFDTICIGETYILPDLAAVSSEGIYESIIPNMAGCDSVITVHLSVNNPDCNDDDCNTADALDTATCSCTHTPIPPPDCNDNNCNTADALDTATCTCTHTPIPPPDCNDNNCNTDDAYDAAACACTHTPIPPPDCNDNNPATEDSYNAADCTCLHVPVPTEGSVVMPGAFSPNNDGVNDVLRPVSNTPVTSMTLRIYNRWGQMLYETTNQTAGWNGTYRGTPQEIGVYVYTLVFTTANNPAEARFMRGNVTLVR
ncbi:hypothetical protein C7N43_36055 [Sphingobacteriales bacterium UPWRP_1]|nr:hypothetical protein C7N43_36055 [Sphingobacteriales bacterium UPWRP_1]